MDEQGAFLKLLKKQKVVRKSMQPHDITLLSSYKIILTRRKEIENSIEEVDPDCKWNPLNIADDNTVKRVGGGGDTCLKNWSKSFCQKKNIA